MWYRLSERVRWSRRPYHEVPIGRLTELAPWQETCIDALQARYGISFESYYGAHTSLANYAYLDLLDRAWTSTDRPPPLGGMSRMWAAPTSGMRGPYTGFSSGDD